VVGDGLGWALHGCGRSGQGEGDKGEEVWVLKGNKNGAVTRMVLAWMGAKKVSGLG